MAYEGNSLLWAASHREARTHRMGAGSLQIRVERRRRDGEASIRPVLRQEHVDPAGCPHSVRDRENRSAPAGPLMTDRDSNRRTGMMNAITVDVEDYFHVSVFDGHVPRHQWDRLESRVCANTDRVLQILDEAGVCGTFFVLG